ncbi:xylose isomerase-like protein [Gloeophyllum trabeum ATCC 11539]|uniref:Xylose isomerase-like protein n=1 Tax=Gloeophyllum trabeum (strain ATCC 11539 / FP-39264 / Madison 617) TaxID=670483 RepID=S7QHV4_GLOTA|nr:xylose isomerase-like protein [Gloeophyllum trabeum ATCC 11539]EPQ58772.1 xylose isomerase-like protein [Gloeophyllum trabeum ATCC 11539]
MPKLTTIKGPSIHLVQYLRDTPPYNTLDGLARWAASLGFRAVQVPADPRLIDVHRAADDQAYCDALNATVRRHGVEISELSTHLVGQLIAVHPAYDALFDAFAPEAYRGNPKAREEWATGVMFACAKAAKRLGLKAHATFSGSLAWPYFYPWPQRPAGLIDTAFAELAARWRPILDAFDEAGVDVCFEIHPSEDLHDGVSFERFLEHVGGHRRACILYDPSHFVLQQLDYLAFIDIYHERIKAFHVKDAEFVPDGRQGVYGGYTDWQDRAGRTRALGDGQIDFKGIFTRLAKYGYEGWAVAESECAFKDPEVCAVEGAEFIKRHIIPVMGDGAFDDFAGSGLSRDGVREVLGLE